MSQSFADQLAATALSGGNAGFIEDLYEKFLQDPASVGPAWAKYFGDLAGTSTREVAHGEVRKRLLTRQERPPVAPPRGWAFQTTSAEMLEPLPRRLVPPQARTCGLEAGKST